MFIKRITIILLGLILLFCFSESVATHPKQYKVIDGIAVYLTVIPAEMLLGYDKALPGSELHNDVHSLQYGQHHIVVSLFDIKTKARLQKAKIRARILVDGRARMYKNMHLMIMGGVKTYGNSFKVPQQGVYNIELEVKPFGTNKTSTIIFTYASA